MHPLAPMRSIHGAWLTPVATRTLAGEQGVIADEKGEVQVRV